jgi:hypothetical protein
MSFELISIKCNTYMNNSHIIRIVYFEEVALLKDSRNETRLIWVWSKTRTDSEKTPRCLVTKTWKMKCLGKLTAWKNFVLLNFTYITVDLLFEL